MKSHDFHQQRREADTPDLRLAMATELKRLFPHCLGVERSHPFDDKLGTDFYVRFRYNRTLGVDAKVRRKDYAASGGADILLELKSNFERDTPGWALDSAKLCDYVLFYWPSTGRSTLYDWHALHAVTAKNWRIWVQQYGAIYATTGDKYRTQCVCLPDAHLTAAITEHQRNTRKAA